MSRVNAAIEVPGTVHEAERCWYDTGRWAEWVEGLEHVDAVDPSWPAAGAVVRWHSGPAGRGQVTERVAAHEPLAGHTVEVSDDSIDGRQTVSFVPRAEDEVAVELELDYRIRGRNLLTPLVDWLFVRPAMRHSIEATLERFAATLADGRARRSIDCPAGCSCSRQASSAPARWAGRSRSRSPTPGSRSCSRTSSRGSSMPGWPRRGRCGRRGSTPASSTPTVSSVAWG